MRRLVLIALAAAATGCATLTEDAMTPVAFSFSDGSGGSCELMNKRGAWTTEVPATVMVRKSDDALVYRCATGDGREGTGSIASTMGAKIVASAVFLDLGITDAITDKHREYPASFVIPVAPVPAQIPATVEGREETYKELERLADLHRQGILSDEEFEAEKKRLLESD